MYGSKRCDEILRLIDEALDALGSDVPGPRAALRDRPRRDRTRQPARAAATASTGPTA